MRILKTTVGLLLLSLAIAPAAAALNVTIGEPPDPATGNCFPFGCSDPEFGPGTRYQQVYSGASFPGPILIQTITFFNTQVFPGAVQIHPARYEIHLSTTSKAVNGLDLIDLDENVGTDDRTVFSAMLSGTPGTDFAIVLSTPFQYNPTEGNLLLDVFKSDFSPLSIGTAALLGFAFLDARNGSFGSESSRAHDFGSDFEGWGLVTNFSGENGPQPVPSPASLILLTGGILGVGRVMWAHRRRACGTPYPDRA
jgi:hypothetical protein